MNKVLFLLAILFTFNGLTQDEYFVNLGNAPMSGLLIEGGINFSMANAYLGNDDDLEINQNYLGARLKAEYGLFRNIKIGTELNTKNDNVQDGKLGVKYEIPLVSKFVLKNDNSMAIVIAPEANFIFPLSNYSTESVLAVGNRNMGVALGSTFWIPIYRINADLKVYGGYNIFFQPVPHSFQLFSSFGKIIGPVYAAAHFNWQKSFGDADYFLNDFLSFRELPITYTKVGLEAKYLHNYKWEAGIVGEYLFGGQNVRKAWGVEACFTYFLDFGKGY